MSAPGIAVAAPHSAAVEAARAVGGNAFDAALAAAAALAVAYPHQCSAGGDLVAIVRAAGREPRAVLSIGAAAQAVDVDGLRAAGDRMPVSGPLTVTVPGVVAGWAAVAAAGATRPLGELLAPAIGLAADGVAVSPGLRRAALAGMGAVRADPGLSSLMLDRDGVRDQLVQPALARTLTAIAADWRSFYDRPPLVDGLRMMGSPLDAADFAAHRAEVLEPLRAARPGVTWFAAPPPAQGATFLSVVGSAALVDDAWRARAVRDAQLGDPRTELKPTGDTVAVAAVDSDGNAVTLIQSVFFSFGAGLLDPATGVVLHNRGSSFSLDPAHPARIAPGVRPPHTLCPTVGVTPDGVVALGCQGGRAQPWILAQVAAGVLSAGDLDALVGRPRWVIGAAEIGRDVPTLLLEPGLPETAGEGYAVETTGGLHDDAGHVQVARLRGDVLDAGSDPRADGTAAVIGR
ncbi:gamma-glutamyltransferase [Actinoplanes sp. NPDC000266]